MPQCPVSIHGHVRVGVQFAQLGFSSPHFSRFALQVAHPARNLSSARLSRFVTRLQAQSSKGVLRVCVTMYMYHCDSSSASAWPRWHPCPLPRRPCAVRLPSFSILCWGGVHASCPFCRRRGRCWARAPARGRYMCLQEVLTAKGIGADSRQPYGCGCGRAGGEEGMG